mmetsp:Transcript_69363/g.137109  ORF Transcript_69363/g.137109 Transcript_69363/m.137109 type:complete len:80 (+) Transcript_69363:688-927(+)
MVSPGRDPGGRVELELRLLPPLAGSTGEGDLRPCTPVRGKGDAILLPRTTAFGTGERTKVLLLPPPGMKTPTCQLRPAP